MNQQQIRERAEMEAGTEFPDLPALNEVKEEYDFHDLPRKAYVQGFESGYSAAVIEWIPTDDRIPVTRQYVLVILRASKRIREVSWEEGTDQNATWFQEYFSHWAVLPTKPE